MRKIKRKRSPMFHLVNVLIIFIGALFVISILLELVIGISGKTVRNERTVIVTGKERVVKNDTSKYLIFCEDSNGEIIVYENTDSIIYLKFNSSDLYGKLNIGDTYIITSYGYRIRIFDMYENIIKIKER